MIEEKYEGSLYEKLDGYSESDVYPFHMPGHKRQSIRKNEKSPYLYDITEIDGFDNLHHPQGIIKNRLEQVSEFYHSKKSYYLINGSTCGIMAAISAVTQEKNTIVLARNSHKSSYNTVFLLNLKSDYIYTDYIENYGINGGISPIQLEKFLSEYNGIHEIGAVFVTSPTYEGVVSDIEKIAEIVHRFGILLIVDEAHGAHFGLHEYFPESALTKGADIVIQSLHKTLPSLTQTAILHIGKDSDVDPAVVEKYLAIYQSSSPSYVLMSSIDWCMDFIRKDSREAFDAYVQKLHDFRQKCSQLQYFRLFYRKGKDESFDYDRSKLVIVPDEKYYSGKKLYDVLLEKYHLQMEMASEKYVIAMTSVFDTGEGFDRLYQALVDMESNIRIYAKYRHVYTDLSESGGNVHAYENNFKNDGVSLPAYQTKKSIVCRTIREAEREKCDIIEFEHARGKISKEFIYLYPPGVPSLVPGEVITQDVILAVKRYRELGLNVQGMEDESGRMIKVIQENWKPMNFGEL